MKIGSLFDGSGGFPLAGTMCGIEPVWASEVEPYPIAVTRSRFPNMKHLGDVTKINGAEIEPVDVLSFGFPCQDVSVAGKRKSVKHKDKGDDETTRSGLFWEAIRIIEEMRCATNGEYPKFAVFENVPGLFSAEKGETFRTIVEGLIQIVEPTAVMPDVPKKGWAYADSYVGTGWSFAYRVFDAQYIRTAQRRRRVYAVLDLGGQRARKILFEREGLRGNTPTCGTQRKGTPSDVEGSVGADDREGAVGLDLYNFSVSGDKAVTLNANSGMSANYAGPTVCHGFPLGFRPENVRCYEETATTLCNGTRAGFCNGVVIGLDVYNQTLTGDKSKTLNSAATDSDHIPCVVKEQALFENHSQDTRYKGPLDVCPMLPAQLGTGGNNTPFVVEKDVIALDRVSFNQGKNALCDPQFYEDGTNPTIVAKGPSAVCYWDGTQKSGTLTARNAGGAQRMPDKDNFIAVIEQKPQYIVRRLTPTECARLQGFPDRWGEIDKKSDFTDEEYRFWLEVRNTHAAINGRQTKNYTEKQMLSWYNKLHTDSAEYKMWGNGIALPCALYVMQGIAEVMKGNSNVKID